MIYCIAKKEEKSTLKLDWIDSEELPFAGSDTFGSKYSPLLGSTLKHEESFFCPFQPTILQFMGGADSGVGTIAGLIR